MISCNEGHVGRGLYVCGLTWSPLFLLKTSPPILFEAGFSCASLLYEQDIRKALKRSPPEILFLTHVHWDHCGGVSHIQQAFPRVKIAASTRAAAILARPNARKLMAELNRNMLPIVARAGVVDNALLSDAPFRPFHVDMQISDGQEIRAAKDLTVQVLATPGHTWDHVSYYIPEKKILIAGEAAGTLELTDYVDVQFLADFDAYVASLKRLTTLPAEILCQGHHFVFTGQRDIKRFLKRSLEATELYHRDIVDLLLREKGSVDAVVARLKAERYDPITGLKQPEDAYLINLKAQVALLHRKHWGSPVKA